MTSYLERLVRSRRPRVFLAVSLAAVGLWAFAPYVAGESGGEAYVNAPLIRVTSPIAGNVAQQLPDPGGYIADARPMRLVTARSADSDALRALLGQEAALKAGQALANAQLAELQRADLRLADRSRKFERASVRRLAAGTAAARADALACRAEATDADAQLRRVTALGAKGFASNATIDRARAAADAAGARCTALAARVELSADEAGAARSGMYLGSGTMDTPYAEQQRDRLMLRRQELETIVVEATARRLDLASRIAAAQRQLEAASAYDVTLPSRSTVWSLLASPGASVIPGSALLEVADCSRRFVEVKLPERQTESVLPGQAVKVRLIGADAWELGRVVGTMGAAARRDVAMVAAVNADRDPRLFTVQIALPPPPAAAVSRHCDIGRLAEVRFPNWLS